MVYRLRSVSENYRAVKESDVSEDSYGTQKISDTSPDASSHGLLLDGSPVFGAIRFVYVRKYLRVINKMSDILRFVGSAVRMSD